MNPNQLESKQEALLNNARRLLNEEVSQLDNATLRQLRIARTEAIEKGKKSTDWVVWAGGMATAGVGVLAFTILFNSNISEIDQTLTGMEDLELLSSAEEIELYEDLEFYQWLEEEEATG